MEPEDILDLIKEATTDLRGDKLREAIEKLEKASAGLDALFELAKIPTETEIQTTTGEQ